MAFQQKANRTLNFLNRNFKTCNRRVKERLYTTYVRPSCESSSSAWDPQTEVNKEKLERVQKRAAKFVTGKYGRDVSVTAEMRDLGWTPLVERRARAKVTSVYKATHDMVDIPFDFPHTQTFLRGAKNYYISFVRTNVCMNSYYPNAIRQWNKLPVSIRESATLSDFERSIRGHTITHHY